MQVSATLQIRQVENGLCIRVREPRNLRTILLSVLAGVLLIYFVLHSSSTPKQTSVLFVSLCLIALVENLISKVRGTNVELLVTNLDFKSTGHAPKGYKRSIISRADIDRLEFREASGGVDAPDLPQGLYVEHRGDSLWSPGTCVLPQIDRAQTEEVMNAIYSRFPDTGTLSPTDPSDFISLNLSKPAPRNPML